MNWKFYELKFRVLEAFYDIVINEKLDYSTAAERTFYEFHAEMREKGIEKIIVILTVERRILEHNVINENTRENVKEVISLFDSIDIKSIVDEDEYEVICEDIGALKTALNF